MEKKFNQDQLAVLRDCGNQLGGDRFDELIVEVEATMKERGWIAREELLKSRWEVGDLIVKELEETGVNSRLLLQGLAIRIGKKERTLYYCLAFRRIAPDFDKFMVENTGKSWNQICHALLDGGPGKRAQKLSCKKKLSGVIPKLERLLLDERLDLAIVTRVVNMMRIYIES